ncbi:MAG: hypothetical protein ACYDG6_04820 [Thermincolia bacterium]
MTWSEFKTKALQYKTQLAIGGSLVIFIIAGITIWTLMDKNTVIQLDPTLVNTKGLSTEVLDMVAANVYQTGPAEAGKISVKARDLSLATGRAIGTLGVLYRESIDDEVNPDQLVAKAKELASGGLPVQVTQQLKQAGLKEWEIARLQENLTNTSQSNSPDTTLKSFQQANLSLYRLQVASSILYVQAMSNQQEQAGKKPLPLDVTEATTMLTAANGLVNDLENPTLQWPTIHSKAKDLRQQAEKNLAKSPFNKHLGTMALAALELENAATAAQDGNQSFALLQAAHWKTILKETAKENKLAFSNLQRVAQVGMTDITGKIIDSYTDDYLEKISLTISGVPQVKTLPKQFTEEKPLFAKEFSSLKHVVTVTNNLTGLLFNPDITANVRVYTTVYADVYTTQEITVKKWNITAQTKGAYNNKMNIDPARKYQFKFQQPLYQVVYYPNDTPAPLTTGQSQIPDLTMPKVKGFFLKEILSNKNLKPLIQSGEAQFLAGLTNGNSKVASGGASIITLAYTLDSLTGKLEQALGNKSIYDMDSPVLDEDELITGLKNSLNGYLKYPYQPNLKAAQQLLDNSVTVAFKTYQGTLTQDSLKSDPGTVMGEVYVDNYRILTMNYQRVNLLAFYSYQITRINSATANWNAPENSGQYYKVITMEKVGNKWLIADIKPYQPKPEEFRKETQILPYTIDPESTLVTLKLKNADLDNLQILLEKDLKTKHADMSGLRMDVGFDQRMVEFDKERLLVVNDYVTVLNKTFSNIATYKITARKYGPFWKLESLTKGAPPLNDFLARSLFFDFFTSVKSTKNYKTTLSYTTGEASTKVKKYRSGSLKATLDPIFQLNDLDANNLTKVSEKGKLFTYEIVTTQTPGSSMTFRIVFELVGDKYLIKSWQNINQPQPTEPTQTFPPATTPAPPNPVTSDPAIPPVQPISPPINPEN